MVEASQRHVACWRPRPGMWVIQLRAVQTVTRLITTASDKNLTIRQQGGSVVGTRMAHRVGACPMMSARIIEFRTCHDGTRLGWGARLAPRHQDVTVGK